MKKPILLLSLTAFIAGCSSTPPTKIGGGTYYAAKPNTAGAFGSVANVLGSLMAEGGQYCDSLGKEFELVTQNTSEPAIGRMGGASITFRCVDQSKDRVMRPDRGVTTIEHK